ncbi:MAG: hypothetical protein ACQEQA_01640 [Bacillota bacterium]
MNEKILQNLFAYWKKVLRLKESWDVSLEIIRDEGFRKTGDFKVDPDDKKAVLLLNGLNPNGLNMEEVMVHELLHLKLYPLDQVTESLIDAHYDKDTEPYDFAYSQFMTSLEQTVAELTKCFLLMHGKNKELSFGRVKNRSGYNALFEGLKPYGNDNNH